MKVISLFSGAGGLDLGLVQAGNQIVWANDIDPYAVETYKFNIGDHIVLGDIKNISVESIPNADVVVGGIAHFVACVLLVIDPAEIVALLNIFVQPDLPVLRQLLCPVHAVLNRGIEENIEGVDPGLPEDIVGAAADDDAGGLGQFQDDLLLGLEDPVVGAGVGDGAVEDRVEHLVGRAQLLALLPDLILGIAALFSRLFYKIPVVVGDPEPVGKSLRQ